jgi:glycosyltransferase involved in cell wall biosynthesis
MTAPLVSVVIPCYKQAAFLPEAIDSVLAQTYQPVEAIVVDDGSPDDTAEVAARYGDSVRYVRRENGGISAARNTGLAHVCGDYVKFLDSDDHIHPESIAWHMEALAGSDRRVSMTAVRLFRHDHPEQYVDHVVSVKTLLPHLFKDMDWGGLHGFLFPMKLVRAAGGFEEWARHGEDWQFLCKVGLQDPEFLPDARVGAYYRLRGGTASTNRPLMVTTRARLLTGLHDALKASGRRDWFGIDLLRFEQGVYQGLVLHDIQDATMLNDLLVRIQELQTREGFGAFGWRFRLMARVFGYARAERLRSWVVHRLNIRPPEELDTGAWRQADCGGKFPNLPVESAS